MKPFPIVTTARITLRKILVSDHEEILQLRTNDEINRYIIRPPERQIKTKESAITFIQNLDKSWENDQIVAWGICLKNKPKLIGTICLWNFSEDGQMAEVGYDLHPKFQRKGYMSEAIQEVIAFGFNKKQLVTIEACTHADNEGSKRLLEKNGFKHHPERIDIGFEHNSVFVIENITG